MRRGREVLVGGEIRDWGCFVYVERPKTRTSALSGRFGVGRRWLARRVKDTPPSLFLDSFCSSDPMIRRCVGLDGISFALSERDLERLRVKREESGRGGGAGGRRLFAFSGSPSPVKRSRICKAEDLKPIVKRNSARNDRASTNQITATNKPERTTTRRRERERNVKF